MREGALNRTTIRQAFAAAAVAAGAACPALAGQEALPVAVPSGVALTLQEVLVEPGAAGQGGLARFRYVAAGITGTDFATVEPDFPVLCAEAVLPWAREQAVPVARVVISIASEPVEFGATAPGVIQFFEVFRLEPTACIWEGF